MKTDYKKTNRTDEEFFNDDLAMDVDLEKMEEITKPTKGSQGFASMSRQKQREIASKGGKAAHEAGTAHEWTSEEAAKAGRKGGSIKVA